MENSVKKFVEYLKSLKNEAEKTFEKGNIIKRSFSDKNISVYKIMEDSKEYLEVDADNFEYSKLNTDLEEIGTVLKILEKLITYVEDEIENHYRLFDDFEVLSDILSVSPLKEKEKFDVLVYIFKKNNLTRIDESNITAIDINKLINYKFKTMTQAEVEDLIYNDKINEYMYTKSEKPLDVFKKAELDVVLEMMRVDASKTISNNKILYDKLVTNRSSLTDEDIDLIINTMRKLHISESLLNVTRVILLKEIAKRKHQENKTAIKPIIIKKSSEELLTDKEYTAIKKEVYTYYNLKKCIFNRKITFKEAIYCASLMIKLGLSREEIDNFFKTFYSSWDERMNILTKFISSRDKLGYYFSKEELSDIDSAFESIFVCDDEEYIFWKAEMISMLSELQNKINGKYEYEYSLAKKK